MIIYHDDIYLGATNVEELKQAKKSQVLMIFGMTISEDGS